MYSSRHSFAHPAVWLKSANAGLRPPTSQSDGKGAFPLTHWDRTLRTIRSLLSASTRTHKEHNSFTGYQPYALTGRTVVPLVQCPFRHPGPPALLQVTGLH